MYDTLTPYVNVWFFALTTEGRKMIVQSRIDKKLGNDLKKIAAELFEGNVSMVVRLALREFRDRRLRRDKSPSAEGHESGADPNP